MPSLIGLIAARTQQLPGEHSRLQEQFPQITGGDVRSFTETSVNGFFPPNDSVAGNVFFVDVRGVFEHVFVGFSVPVLDTPWGNAFLLHIETLVRRGGEFYIRCPLKRGPDGHDRESLERLFGQKAEMWPSSQWLRFESCGFVERPPSVLTWFLEHYGAVVHAIMLLKALPVTVNMHRYDDLALEAVLRDAEALVQRPRDWVGQVDGRREPDWFSSRSVPPLVYGEAFQDTLVRMATMLVTVRDQAVAVRHLLREHCEVGRGGKLIHFGGRFGFLVAELLLDPELELGRGVVCEYGTVFTTGSALLYRGLRRHLRHRFFFASARTRDYEFEAGESYSVILLLSHLGAVPESERRAVAERCWDHLDPGGIMIVFETGRIRPDRSSPPWAEPASDLDAWFGEHGAIYRYGSRDLARVAQSDGASGGVYHVVVRKARSGQIVDDGAGR